MVTVVQLHPSSGAAALEPLAQDLRAPDRALVARALEFVDELPHTATGKLSKLTLRKQFRDYRFADAENLIGRG